MVCRSGIISLFNPGRQAADRGGVYRWIEVFAGMGSICDGKMRESVHDFVPFLELTCRVVVRIN